MAAAPAPSPASCLRSVRAVVFDTVFDTDGVITDSARMRVAAREDELFTRSLRADPVDVRPGTVRLLDALRDARVPCAAVPASRHATHLLVDGATDDE